MEFLPSNRKADMAMAGNNRSAAFDHPQGEHRSSSSPATALQEQWVRWVETFFLPILMGRRDGPSSWKERKNPTPQEETLADEDIDDSPSVILCSTEDDSSISRNHYYHDGESYSHSHHHIWQDCRDDDDTTLVDDDDDDNPMIRNYELDQLQFDMDITQQRIGNLQSEFQEDLMELSVRLEDAFQRFDDESLDVMMQIQNAQGGMNSSGQSTAARSTTTFNSTTTEEYMMRIHNDDRRNNNKRTLSSSSCTNSLKFELEMAENIGQQLQVYGEEDDNVQNWFDKVWSTTETVFLDRMQCGGKNSKQKQEEAKTNNNKTLYQRWKSAAWWTN